MENPRLIALAAIVVLALAGCRDSDTIELRNRVAICESKLADQKATEAARIEHLERAAGIAAGCDWLVPVCPASAVELGRDALKAGYTGATSIFLLALLAKCAVIGALAGGLIGALVYLRTRLLAPARADIDAALEAIATAQDQVAASARQRDALQQEISSLFAERDTTLSGARKAKTELAEVQAQLDRANRKRAAAEAAVASITALKG